MSRNLGEPGLDVGTFNGHPFEPIDRVRFHPVRLAHDEHGSHGFVIEGFGCRIGYATDLGRVPGELLDRFCGVDALAIESNYDPEMEMNSPRPWFLKKRIMGGKGHLSNEQAAELLAAVLARSEPERLLHVVSLHLSQECNRPELARTAARAALSGRAEALAIHVAAQHRAGPRLHVGQALRACPRRRLIRA